MSINSIGSSQNSPREVRLSEIRRNRESNKTDWTNDDLRVMPEPEDSFMDESVREAGMQSSYAESAKQKYDYDHGQGDSIFKGIITTEDFLSRDSAIATDENSTVLSKEGIPGEEITEQSANMPSSILMDYKGEPVNGEIPTSPGELESRMDMKTRGAGKQAAIGTFNIEWLGMKKRSEADYKEIAQIIKDSGASVLGLEEVANLDGLRRVLKYLPDYGYILGKSGQQMVGIIFDKDRVTYDANSIEQLEDATVGNPGLRPPLSVDMKVDNFDFNMVVMHLKAGFKPSAIETRNKQAKIINRWLQDHYKDKADKDVILVGDYNDYVGSEALDALDKGDTVDYTTQDGDAKGIYSNIRYKTLIDHGAVSNVEGGAADEFIEGSVRTIDENQFKNYSERISDHKPILFDVRTDEDKD